MIALSDSCVFCKIIEGSAESSEVYRDEFCVAFLDSSPINPGHTLVCPTRHTSSFIDLEADELSAILSAAQRIARRQLAKMPNCGGVNLLLSEREDAGQEVPHAQFHVLPRSENDGFGWQRFGSPQTRDELDTISAQIKIR